MNGPIGEFAQAAYVVAMEMGSDREQAVLLPALDQVTKGCEPEGRVDHEVGVATANVPDVAEEERVHMWFGDERYALVRVLANKPRIGNGQFDHLIDATDPCSDNPR
jgi:hypothetical protein